MSEIAERRANRSDSIGKLAAALSKAQGAMEGAVKDSANPFFKSKYADLAAVWDACRQPLSANELAVVQIVDDAEVNARIVVETILMHSSGEWISGRIAMKPVKDDPQGIGSCITYARRYGLQAIVGIAPEDDDGNAASGRKSDGSERTQEATPLKAKPKEAPSGGNGNAEHIIPSEDQLITVEQQQKLHIRFREALKEELQPRADEFLRDFLSRKLILDKDGNPSAKGIRKDEYAKLGPEAVAFAKGI